MKELDDLLERQESLYTPIIIGGKEYPGNNPYILNKINNLLYSGKLKVEEIRFDETKVELLDKESGEPYFYYQALDQINNDICNEYKEIGYSRLKQGRKEAQNA